MCHRGPAVTRYAGRGSGDAPQGSHEASAGLGALWPVKVNPLCPAVLHVLPGFLLEADTALLHLHSWREEEDSGRQPKAANKAEYREGALLIRIIAEADKGQTRREQIQQADRNKEPLCWGSPDTQLWLQPALSAKQIEAV